MSSSSRRWCRRDRRRRSTSSSSTIRRTSTPSSANSSRQSRRHTGKPAPRTTRSPCAWTPAAAPSSSAATTTSVRTRARWKTACSSSTSGTRRRCAETAPGRMTTAFTTLISATELAALLSSSRKPVVIDTSFDLADTDAGEKRFRASHVPGSHYLHLDRDLSAAKTGRNGRHPLPDRGEFARTVAALGIGPETQVVALDAQGGAYAARLWWMLRWLGHRAVAVLDGGMQAWQRAGGALTDQPSASPLPTPTPYPERPSLAPSVDAAGVATRPPRRAVLDA